MSPAQKQVLKKKKNKMSWRVAGGGKSKKNEILHG